MNRGKLEEFEPRLWIQTQSINLYAIDCVNFSVICFAITSGSVNHTKSGVICREERGKFTYFLTMKRSTYHLAFPQEEQME